MSAAMTNPQIKAVIVDDEPGCIDNLQYYIKTYCPDMEIIATGSRLSEVDEVLNTAIVDVIFLDVELYDENVFDLLQERDALNCRIVFVTAYNHYAVNAFKVDALDYVLKPLSRQDIQSCYSKIKKWMALSSEPVPEAPAQTTVSKAPATIALRQGERIYVVKTTDILYLEARGMYTRVCFLYQGARHEILISKMLNHVAQEYTGEEFFRVHKSYVINVHNVSTVLRQGTLNVEMKTGDRIPVAKRRAHEFIEYIQSQGIH